MNVFALSIAIISTSECGADDNEKMNRMRRRQEGERERGWGERLNPKVFVCLYVGHVHHRNCIRSTLNLDLLARIHWAQTSVWLEWPLKNNWNCCTISSRSCSACFRVESFFKQSRCLNKYLDIESITWCIQVDNEPNISGNRTLKHSLRVSTVEFQHKYSSTRLNTQRRKSIHTRIIVIPSKLYNHKLKPRQIIFCMRKITYLFDIRNVCSDFQDEQNTRRVLRDKSTIWCSNCFWYVEKYIVNNWRFKL